MQNLNNDEPVIIIDDDQDDDDTDVTDGNQTDNCLVLKKGEKDLINFIRSFKITKQQLINFVQKNLGTCVYEDISDDDEPTPDTDNQRQSLLPNQNISENVNDLVIAISQQNKKILMGFNREVITMIENLGPLDTISKPCCRKTIMRLVNLYLSDKDISFTNFAVRKFMATNTHLTGSINQCGEMTQESMSEEVENNVDELSTGEPRHAIGVIQRRFIDKNAQKGPPTESLGSTNQTINTTNTEQEVCQFCSSLNSPYAFTMETTSLEQIESLDPHLLPFYINNIKELMSNEHNVQIPTSAPPSPDTSQSAVTEIITPVEYESTEITTNVRLVRDKPVPRSPNKSQSEVPRTVGPVMDESVLRTPNISQSEVPSIIRPVMDTSVPRTQNKSQSEVPTIVRPVMDISAPRISNKSQSEVGTHLRSPIEKSIPRSKNKTQSEVITNVMPAVDKPVPITPEKTQSNVTRIVNPVVDRSVPPRKRARSYSEILEQSLMQNSVQSASWNQESSSTCSNPHKTTQNTHQCLQTSHIQPSRLVDTNNLPSSSNRSALSPPRVLMNNPLVIQDPQYVSIPGVLLYSASNADHARPSSPVRLPTLNDVHKDILNEEASKNERRRQVSSQMIHSQMDTCQPSLDPRLQYHANSTHPYQIQSPVSQMQSQSVYNSFRNNNPSSVRPRLPTTSLRGLHISKVRFRPCNTQWRNQNTFYRATQSSINCHRRNSQTPFTRISSPSPNTFNYYSRYSDNDIQSMDTSHNYGYPYPITLSNPGPNYDPQFSCPTSSSRWFQWRQK